MVWKNVHCRTCGQDLPEPQARLAMAEVYAAEERAEIERELARTQASANAAIEEHMRKAAEQRRHDEHLRDTRISIKTRGTDIDPDAMWELREMELPGTNRMRLQQFRERAKLYGKTIEMVRRAVPAEVQHHPV